MFNKDHSWWALTNFIVYRSDFFLEHLEHFSSFNSFLFIHFFFNIDRSSCGIGNLRTTDDNICALEQIESFLFSANLEINYRLNWFFYRYSMILNSFICRIWCENNNEINDSFPMSMNALNSSCCCACYVDYVRYCWWSCQDNRFAVHVCRF